MRRLCKPDLVAVNCIFDAAFFCNFNGVDGWLCNEAASLVDKRFADIANDFFTDERAGNIVDENVFRIASERVDAVFYGLPALFPANDDL